MALGVKGSPEARATGKVGTRNDGAPDDVVIADHDGSERKPSSSGGRRERSSVLVLRRVILSVLLVAALLFSMSWLSGAQAAAPSKRVFCNISTEDLAGGPHAT